MESKPHDIEATAENLLTSLGQNNKGVVWNLQLATYVSKARTFRALLGFVNNNINSVGSLQFEAPMKLGKETLHLSDSADGVGPLHVIVVKELVDEIRESLQASLMRECDNDHDKDQNTNAVTQICDVRLDTSVRDMENATLHQDTLAA